jgi:hypothetical protein
MSARPSPLAYDQVPDYQGAVKRLTAENKRLMAEMARQSAAGKRRIRQLEAQLYEGLAPELAVLGREMRRWRDRALAAEGRLANLRRNA